MNYVMSRGGLVVHSGKGYPCAVCRPDDVLESEGHCLCAKCAENVVVAAGAGVEGARALLGEITEALVLLEIDRTDTTRVTCRKTQSRLRLD